MTDRRTPDACPNDCPARDCGGCSPSPALSGRTYEHLNCLVATEDCVWWQCDCGLPLAEPSDYPATVTCACGQAWRFDRWPIGDQTSGETTEVEPRRA